MVGRGGGCCLCVLCVFFSVLVCLFKRAGYKGFYRLHNHYRVYFVFVLFVLCVQFWSAKKKSVCRILSLDEVAKGSTTFNVLFMFLPPLCFACVFVFQAQALSVIMYGFMYSINNTYFQMYGRM